MANQNPISKLFNSVVNDYFDQWTGIHFLANLSIVWILSKFVPDWYAALGTISIAVLWEIYEWFVEGVYPYGNMRNYMRNTISDLMVAVICIGAVLA